MKGNPLSTVAGFLTDVIEKERGYTLPNCSRIAASTIITLFKWKDPSTYRDFTQFLDILPTGSRESICQFVVDIICHKNLRYQVEGKECLLGSSNGVIVANHPVGVLDGIVLFDALQQLGRKFVFIASNKAAFLDRQQEFIIPLKHNVDLAATYAQIGKKLAEGYDIVIFPAGDISKYDEKTGSITDKRRKWTPALRASTFGVPIYPLHIHVPLDEAGQQQLLSYHKSQLRLLKFNLHSLMREKFLNDIVVTCGPPIEAVGHAYIQPGVPVQKEKTSAFMEQLRAYVYALKE